MRVLYNRIISSMANQRNKSRHTYGRFAASLITISIYPVERHSNFHDKSSQITSQIRRTWTGKILVFSNSIFYSGGKLHVILTYIEVGKWKIFIRNVVWFCLFPRALFCFAFIFTHFVHISIGKIVWEKIKDISLMIFILSFVIVPQRQNRNIFDWSIFMKIYSKRIFRKIFWICHIFSQTIA